MPLARRLIESSFNKSGIPDGAIVSETEEEVVDCPFHPPSHGSKLSYLAGIDGIAGVVQGSRRHLREVHDLLFPTQRKVTANQNYIICVRCACSASLGFGFEGHMKPPLVIASCLTV